MQREGNRHAGAAGWSVFLAPKSHIYMNYGHVVRKDSCLQKDIRRCLCKMISRKTEKKTDWRYHGLDRAED